MLTPAAATADTAAPLAVSVSSLDTAPGTGGTPVVLPGHWFVASGPNPAPALVLLHGCGGVFDRSGALAMRYTELAARLNRLGVHALVVDSLIPRGESELCTQKTGQRRVTQLNRRRDALGALDWLAAQPGVDPSRTGLLGWSNGGSTVLAATGRGHAEVAAAPAQTSLAVAFYPGCETELQRGYQPTAPLLLLLGDADDWTPAAPCKALAASVTQPPGVQWQAYPGAYHGFDGRGPVRLRRDVPNGVNPGQGVHVGGNPEARMASAARLETFLREQWKLKP